jgi:hypothetical protein
MKRFSTFLTEDAQGKNLHLEHLEDEILNFGIGGARGSVNFLRSLRDMMAGNSRTSINMTVKWAGAPAIFAGVDPSDGKFFVAKKSVFNKTPLLYKTAREIDSDARLPAPLKPKFKTALTEFSKLGITNVLQGDLMFTSSDLETDRIDGQTYTTFQPNTIVYAIPKGSFLERKMKSAKIGVVWHTTYKGTSLENMKASFGADTRSLRKPSSVWMDDATYKDSSGTATFTKAETDQVTAKLSEVGKAFNKISSAELTKFLRIQASFEGKFVGAGIKTYTNSKVRVGQEITNPSEHAKGYLTWVEEKFDKEQEKVKTDKTKKTIEDRKTATLRDLRKLTDLLVNVIIFQNLLISAKMMIVSKLNKIKQLANTFVRTPTGFKVVNPEGYVAIDRTSGRAVKLVDRMEFSYNNFTAIKAWDR